LRDFVEGCLRGAIGEVCVAKRDTEDVVVAAGDEAYVNEL
jgi:hypothetical protein